MDIKVIDIIILAVIALIVFLVVKKMRSNKRKGQKCASCHLKDNCTSRTDINNNSCH